MRRMRRQNTVIIIGLRLLMLLKRASTANSFLLHHFNHVGWKNHHLHRRKCSVLHESDASDVQEEDVQRARTKYGIGGVDLYSRWIALVDQGHVTATTTMSNEDICDNYSSDNDDDSLNVRYGVKLFKKEGESKIHHLVEFVELLHENNVPNSSKMKERIRSINETLSEMQSTLWTKIDSGDNNSGLAIKFIEDGPYVVQLQLVRTLRPPRSKEMSGTDVIAATAATATASCQPPQYNQCNSFLVGQLRLFGQEGDFHGEGEPRVRIAKLSARPNEADQRMWDIYHNISPVDPRGHFLLLPDLEESKKNWRDQSLIANDCYDMTYLASTIQPAGSLIITFNSVGAGASQNHIHCHGWVYPPPPLVQEGRRSGYAVEIAAETSSLTLKHGTTVSLLDYPCSCIKLSVVIDGGKGADKQRPPFAALDEFGGAIATIVQIAQEMEAPHNVAWTNRNNSNEGTATLKSYIFFRSKAETTITNGVFRLGASEVLGLFHCSSNDEMKSLSGEGFMESILRDVSKEPRDMIWDRVESELSKI